MLYIFIVAPVGFIQTEIGAPFKQQVKVDKVYSSQLLDPELKHDYPSNRDLAEN
jgi:hypothetical protein